MSEENKVVKITKDGEQDDFADVPSISPVPEDDSIDAEFEDVEYDP